MNAKWKICPHCEGDGTVVIPMTDEYSENNFYDWEDEDGPIPETYTKQCNPCSGLGKLRVTPHIEVSEDIDAVCLCDECRYERLVEHRASRRMSWMEDGCRGNFSDYYIESWDYRDIGDC